MASRVTVTVTARDMTHAQLGRMRHNFNSLGQDLDRAVGQRSRQNFARLSQSVNQSRRDLQAMRGSIPDDEFFRLDDAARRAQRTLQRGFGNVGDRAFQRAAQNIRDLDEGFRRLDRDGEIRVRVDTSALRRADARLAAWRGEQRRNGVRVPVTPDVDRHRWRTAILRGASDPLRSLGQSAGGIMQDGIGDGIVSGFRGAGPVGIAFFATFLTAAFSVVGAALSGLLITALGAAFAGVGVVAAATSKKIKKEWSSTLNDLKEDFRGVGEPMIPVLDRGLDRLRQMSGTFAPILKQAVSDTSGATEAFINKIADGFESFGKAAFKPIMDAWNVFAPVFGSEWDEFMDELGHSFANMARLVEEHPTEIAAALDVLFETLDLLVDAVTFFGEVWVHTLRDGSMALATVIDSVKLFAVAILNSFDIAVDAVGIFLSMIPGMGDAADDARTAFDNFKEGIISDLGEAARSIRGYSAELDRANRVRRLEADISTWQSKLAEARRQLKKTTSQKARAKLTADISSLEAQVLRATQLLNALNGKTAYTYVYTSTSQGGHPTQRHNAKGGVVGMAAAATGGVRSNMTMVGEQGVEIVDLPAGSRVRSNPDTRRIMRQGAGGGSAPMQVNLVVDGKVLASAMFDPTREIIRGKGGVTRAYGG